MVINLLYHSDEKNNLSLCTVKARKVEFPLLEILAYSNLIWDTQDEQF